MVKFVESESTFVDARGGELGGMGRENGELVFNSV